MMLPSGVSRQTPRKAGASVSRWVGELVENRTRTDWPAALPPRKLLGHVEEEGTIRLRHSFHVSLEL